MEQPKACSHLCLAERAASIKLGSFKEGAMLSAHLSRAREGSTEGGGLPFINCIILSFQADLRRPKGGDFFRFLPLLFYLLPPSQNKCFAKTSLWQSKGFKRKVRNKARILETRLIPILFFFLKGRLVICTLYQVMLLFHCYSGCKSKKS